MTDLLCGPAGHHPICATAAVFITMPQCASGPLNDVQIKAVNVMPEHVIELLERALDRWREHLKTP